MLSKALLKDLVIFYHKKAPTSKARSPHLCHMGLLLTHYKRHQLYSTNTQNTLFIILKNAVTKTLHMAGIIIEEQSLK